MIGMDLVGRVAARDVPAATSPPTEGRAHRSSDDTTAKGGKFVLGVTGNIASGKSTVVRRLVEHGATAFDADLVYRELIAPGRPLLAAIADHFGDEKADVLAQSWRKYQLEYTWRLNSMGK